MKRPVVFTNTLEHTKADGPTAVRTELFPGGMIPVANQWLREAVEGHHVLSAPTSSSTQNSLDLPCGVRVTK